MERFHTHLDTCIWSIIWKWLNWPFWASFEKPDFLTIFEVSYDPKQWRYTVFDVEFGFSAVDYPYRWILSPMLGDLYGFPGPSKVPFSAFKVGVQENFHWCFLNDLARKKFFLQNFFLVNFIEISDFLNSFCSNMSNY